MGQFINVARLMMARSRSRSRSAEYSRYRRSPSPARRREKVRNSSSRSHRNRNDYEHQYKNGHVNDPYKYSESNKHKIRSDSLQKKAKRRFVNEELWKYGEVRPSQNLHMNQMMIFR